MEKEFNLSEKKWMGFGKGVYLEKDIKEFIKRLKKNICNYWTNGVGTCICPECWENRELEDKEGTRTNECMFNKIDKEIDKLAGDAFK